LIIESSPPPSIHGRIPRIHSFENSHADSLEE
jgi:hypothetical protein